MLPGCQEPRFLLARGATLNPKPLVASLRGPSSSSSRKDEAQLVVAVSCMFCMGKDQVVALAGKMKPNSS